MILSNRFRRMETVVRVEENTVAEPVYCLTTTTENFIADGFCSHNCIALYPQGTAAGVLKRTIRDLHNPDSPNYIGDAYYGRTCFRAPIHDSGLFEIPILQWDSTCEHIFRAFQAPVLEQPMPTEWNMGAYLTIGVEAKAGANWLDVEKIQVPGMAALGLSNETTYFGVEEVDEEEAAELGTVA